MPMLISRDITLFQNKEQVSSTITLISERSAVDLVLSFSPTGLDIDDILDDFVDGRTFKHVVNAPLNFVIQVELYHKIFKEARDKRLANLKAGIEVSEELPESVPMIEKPPEPKEIVNITLGSSEHIQISSEFCPSCSTPDKIVYDMEMKVYTCEQCNARFHVQDS